MRNMKLYQRGPILTPTSEQELLRRQEAVRTMLQEMNLDCVLLYVNQTRQDSPVRYLFDYPCDGSYGFFCIFPKEGGAALFGHGAEGGTAIPSACAIGLEVNESVPFVSCAHFTNPYVPAKAVDFLKKRGYRKVGLYRTCTMPLKIVEVLREQIPGVSFTEVDDALDRIHAVKSAEELEILRNVVGILDDIYAALPAIVRPGKVERLVANEIMKYGMDLGCETFNIMMGRKHKSWLSQNEKIPEHGSVDLLVELSGPGNYYAELSRTWAFGEPDAELERTVADSVTMQGILAETARPGVAGEKLVETMHEFQKARGYLPEKRLFGHSMGVDMVERPVYVPGEKMTFEENMFLSIHPGMETPSGVWGFNTDNYIVTKTGTERVSKTPQGLFCFN